MTDTVSSGEVGDASPGWSEAGAGTGVPLGADAVAGEDADLSSVGVAVVVGSTFAALVVGCEGVTSCVSLSNLMMSDVVYHPAPPPSPPQPHYPSLPVPAVTPPP
jgi:hypothetical protein